MYVLQLCICVITNVLGPVAVAERGITTENGLICLVISQICNVAKIQKLVTYAVKSFQLMGGAPRPLIRGSAPERLGV